MRFRLSFAWIFQAPQVPLFLLSSLCIHLPKHLEKSLSRSHPGFNRNLYLDQPNQYVFPYLDYSSQALEGYHGPTDPFSQTDGVSRGSSSYINHSEPWLGAADLRTGIKTTLSVGHTPIVDIRMPNSATSHEPTAPPTPDHTTRLETPTSFPYPLPFKTETKHVYICTYQSCNKKYGRLPELRRHQRGAHLNDQRWKCRSAGCDRTMRGFPRRDKRDDHERKVHQRHGVA